MGIFFRDDSQIQGREMLFGAIQERKTFGRKLFPGFFRNNLLPANIKAVKSGRSRSCRGRDSR